MEINGEGDAAELLMLMRDVASYLVAEGDAVAGAGVHVGLSSTWPSWLRRFGAGLTVMVC